MDLVRHIHGKAKHFAITHCLDYLNKYSNESIH
jgi:hypothetical protein